MWRFPLLAEMVDVLDLDLDLRKENVAGRICIDVASEWALYIVVLPWRLRSRRTSRAAARIFGLCEIGLRTRRSAHAAIVGGRGRV